MGNELQSYIDLCNLSGEFICNVESLYGTKQVSLFLYEKGMIILSVNPQAISNIYYTCIKLIASFQLLLAVNKRMVCIQIMKVNRIVINIKPNV